MVLQQRGDLTDKEIRTIQRLIKKNYREMCLVWSALSDHSYYGENG